LLIIFTITLMWLVNVKMEMVKSSYFLALKILNYQFWRCTWKWDYDW